jgi:hypothetical protein
MTAFIAPRSVRLNRVLQYGGGIRRTEVLQGLRRMKFEDI